MLRPHLRVITALTLGLLATGTVSSAAYTPGPSTGPTTAPRAITIPTPAKAVITGFITCGMLIRQSFPLEAA